MRTRSGEIWSSERRRIARDRFMNVVALTHIHGRNDSGVPAGRGAPRSHGVVVGKMLPRWGEARIRRTAHINGCDLVRQDPWEPRVTNVGGKQHGSLRGGCGLRHPWTFGS